ncbi:MAG: hypothetical protein JO010_01450 [Alphaproteobacteria bacterium]|nr:hypothetical protein [Alphaproteobacteria bacterium]
MASSAEDPSSVERAVTSRSGGVSLADRQLFREIDGPALPWAARNSQADIDAILARID